MKARLLLSLALLLTGCGDEKVPNPRRASSSTNREAGAPVPPSTDDLNRFAARFLRTSQHAVLAAAMEHNARENLRSQLTPGGAEVAKLEYARAQQSAKDAGVNRDSALKALVAEEDRLAKAGLKWDEGVYSNVILAYEDEAKRMRREYELASIRGHTGDLHARWLDFLSVTIEQIRSGEY